MKNRSNLAVFLIIALALLVSASIASAQVSNGDDDVSASASVVAAPSNGTVSNGDDDVQSPVVTASAGTNSGANVSNGDDDVQTPASNQITGGTTGASVTNGDDDVIATIAPEKTDPTPSTGGRSSRSRISSTTPVVLGSASSTCEIISSYMKKGWNNDSSQVRALQTFLKNVEKINVDINGIFDEQTENAVMAFQTKHLDLVLKPWKASLPSGQVFITTKKVINQIACGTPLSLTEDEAKTIAAYIPTRGLASDVDFSTSTGDSIVSATGTLDVTLASVENTAAAGDTSLAKKFWNFITGLFR